MDLGACLALFWFSPTGSLRLCLERIMQQKRPRTACGGRGLRVVAYADSRVANYCAERAKFSQKTLVSHAALAGAATPARTDKATSADAMVFMIELLN